MIDELLERVQLALKSVCADTIEIIKEGKVNEHERAVVLIRVVSKDFKKVRIGIRQNIVDKLIMQKDASLKIKHLLLYDCLTPFEYKISKLKKERLH